MEMIGKQQHFVLVHGAGLGAWSWYKIITLLKKAGHRVTALDLAGQGINPKQLNEIDSFDEYREPFTDFMASLPDGEKVILVGHSYGGFLIALASEEFFNKILVAVYVTAYMPNISSPPATLLEEYFRRSSPSSLSDTKFWYDNGPENPPTAVLLGPNALRDIVYEHSPPEDAELAITLVRPNKFFLEDLDQANLLTKEKFGSVKRVFVLAEDDKVLTKDFQQYMIEKSPPNEVKSAGASDHIVMTSKPTELNIILQLIAAKYA